MIVHVAVDGSDATGDGSAGNPFATIARAASGADPGTAIRVHAGTYGGDQFIEDLTGTAQQPVWIGGAPGEARPVLDGGEVGLRIAGLSYVIIHDLEVRFMTDGGINIDDRGERDNPLAAHHVVLGAVDIHGIGGDGDQACLKLSGVNEIVVQDSAFRLCGGDGAGGGIELVGTRHGLIAGSAFGDFDGSAIQVRGGSSDIEIRANHMQGTGARAVNMGGVTDLAAFRPPLSTAEPIAEARDIRALANLIEGGGSPLAFVGCVDCLAAHNTIVDPGEALLRIEPGTADSDGYVFETTRDGRLINNLVYYSRGILVDDVYIGPDTAPETFVFSHNLWYAHDAPGNSAPALPVSETGAVTGSDPDFLPGGYAIGSSSPAAGAGTSPIPVPSDITGACYSDPPSIGAYEAS